jgi:hypothetical protein
MGLLQMPRMMLPVCTWPQARQETLRESDRVCLHGLSYKPELNQREGTVLAIGPLRASVRLDAQHGAPGTDVIVMLEHVRKLQSEHEMYSNFVY